MKTRAAGRQALVLAFQSGQTLDCDAVPCPGHAADVSAGLGEGQLEIFGFWTPRAGAAPNQLQTTALRVIHTMAGDAGPQLRLLSKKAGKPMEDFGVLHGECLSEDKVMVVRLAGGRELLMAAAWTVTGTGQPATPVFWGYALAVGLAGVGAGLMREGRLALVFDIDETLLQAHTVNSLANALKKSEQSRAKLEAELAAATDAADVQRLTATVSTAHAEERLLAAHHNMLQCYADTDLVHDEQDETFEPLWEDAVMHDGTTVSRPVIRLYGTDGPSAQPTAIFTRIWPEKRETSMLIRPREGWQALRHHLCGKDDVAASGRAKFRFDVYVCTTAEREYALEAWRLLDTAMAGAAREPPVIPPALVPGRVTCVKSGNRKNLMEVLTPGWDASGEHPRVELAVIVDDRTDVWDEATQANILQVAAFQPHTQEAALLVGTGEAADVARESRAELARVLSTIIAIRRGVYFDIQEVLRKKVEALTTTGAAEADQRADPWRVLPRIKSVTALIDDPEAGMPTMLHAAQAQAMRASDLRSRGGAAPGAAPGLVPPLGATAAVVGAAGAAAAPPVPAGSSKPIDPRKQRRQGVAPAMAAAQASARAAPAAAGPAGGGAGKAPGGPAGGQVAGAAAQPGSAVRAAGAPTQGPAQQQPVAPQQQQQPQAAAPLPGGQQAGQQRAPDTADGPAAAAASQAAAPSARGAAQVTAGASAPGQGGQGVPSHLAGPPPPRLARRGGRAPAPLGPHAAGQQAGGVVARPHQPQQQAHGQQPPEVQQPPAVQQPQQQPAPPRRMVRQPQAPAQPQQLAGVPPPARPMMQPGAPFAGPQAPQHQQQAPPFQHQQQAPPFQHQQQPPPLQQQQQHQLQPPPPQQQPPAPHQHQQQQQQPTAPHQARGGQQLLAEPTLPPLKPAMARQCLVGIRAALTTFDWRPFVTPAVVQRAAAAGLQAELTEAVALLVLALAYNTGPPPDTPHHALALLLRMASDFKERLQLRRALVARYWEANAQLEAGAGGPGEAAAAGQPLALHQGHVSTPPASPSQRVVDLRPLQPGPGQQQQQQQQPPAGFAFGQPPQAGPAFEQPTPQQQQHQQPPPAGPAFGQPQLQQHPHAGRAPGQVHGPPQHVQGPVPASFQQQLQLGTGPPPPPSRKRPHPGNAPGAAGGAAAQAPGPQGPWAGGPGMQQGGPHSPTKRLRAGPEAQQRVPGGQAPPPMQHQQRQMPPPSQPPQAGPGAAPPGMMHHQQQLQQQQQQGGPGGVLPQGFGGPAQPLWQPQQLPGTLPHAQHGGPMAFPGRTQGPAHSPGGLLDNSPEYVLRAPQQGGGAGPPLAGVGGLPGGGFQQQAMLPGGPSMGRGVQPSNLGPGAGMQHGNRAPVLADAHQLAPQGGAGQLPAGMQQQQANGAAKPRGGGFGGQAARREQQHQHPPQQQNQVPGPGQHQQIVFQPPAQGSGWHGGRGGRGRGG